MRIRTCLFAVLTLVAGTAAADTSMRYSTPDGTNPEIAIKGDRVRMEGGPRGQGVTLFDASTREIIVLDPSRRSYYRMDAESMKQQGRQVSEQMRQMREQMEKQLENMPEEQRAMMREQMEQMMPDQPAAAGGDIRFERSGESATVAGIDCDVATVYRDGKPAQRVCMAAPDRLGMADSDRATLRSLFTFLQEMASSFGGSGMGAQIPAKMMDSLDGVPIRSEDLEGDQSWTLTDVQTGNVDASRFAVPSGYSEVEPFSMGQ